MTEKSDRRDYGSGAAYWRPAWEHAWQPYEAKQCAGHPPMATYCYLCEKPL